MVAVFVLVVVVVAVLPRMFSAVEANEPEIKTSRRLEHFCQGLELHQFQIVSAIFDKANTSFTRQQLSKVYRNAGDEEKRRTVEKELRKHGEFTIRYICALVGTSAVDPCRFFTGGQKSSVLIPPGGQGDCYRQCSWTPADHSGRGRAGLITITSNILADDDQSPMAENVVEYQVYNAKGEGDGWKCRDLGFQKTSYRDFKKVEIRLLVQRRSLINRLWFSLSGADSFHVSCYTLNNTRPTKCQQKTSTTRRTATTSTPTTPTTTANQWHKDKTTQTETVTNIVNVVVPTGGIIMLAIIIASAALLIKHRQRNSAATTTTLIINPGPGTTSTTRETVPDSSPTRQEDRSHDYCSLAMPETPQTQRDMERLKRKRTAYCHYKDDYEDWVLPVT